MVAVDPSVVAEARVVLEGAWDGERGYCYPHAGVYPHQWLWDSCFHAIAWAAVGDRRGVDELDGVFAVQLVDGFVPHMRYAGEDLLWRGPLSGSSSFTQPPLYAHAARYLAARGFPVVHLHAPVAAGLAHLWRHRRTDDGLIFIVHPWEAGWDDSPRWDSWVGSHDWDRAVWTGFDLGLVADTEWADTGEARWSRRFVAVSAGFCALVAHAFGEAARLTGDEVWERRRRHLAVAVDRELWDDDLGMWIDRPLVGGGESRRIPTVDGLLPLLVTEDRERAEQALDLLGDRFLAPYGVRFVDPDHATYDPNGYWRGAAWPPIDYLVWLAASRWGRTDLADAVATAAVAGTEASGFSEYRNPETGDAHGAVPQTWAAVVAAYACPPVPP